MNKGKLIEVVAKDVGISKALVRKVVDSAIAAITKSLGRGDLLALPRFGTFSISSREARSRSNPRSGEMVKIAASKTAKFKPGSALNHFS